MPVEIATLNDLCVVIFNHLLIISVVCMAINQRCLFICLRYWETFERFIVRTHTRKKAALQSQLHTNNNVYKETKVHV